MRTDAILEAEEIREEMGITEEGGWSIPFEVRQGAKIQKRCQGEAVSEIQQRFGSWMEADGQAQPEAEVNIFKKIEMGRLLLKLYGQIKEPKKMWERIKRDPKTTVSGIVGILAQIAKAAGVNLPPELFDGLTMVAAALFAFFCRDSHPPDVVPK